MKTKRGLFVLLAPLGAGALFLAAAVGFRTRAVDEGKVARKPASGSAARSDGATLPAPVISVPARAPVPAPPGTVSAAVDEARLRSTYANYRTAVATGNGPLRDALEKVLRGDRESAVRLAREDLAQAQTSQDREIAQKTVEALRR